MSFCRRAEYGREFFAGAVGGDGLDVIPIVLARIDGIVDEFVIVRLFGGAMPEDRLLGQLDERTFFAVAAIHVVAEILFFAGGGPVRGIQHTLCGR